jgi:hypothetical protein
MKALKTLLTAGLLALSAAVAAQNDKPYLTKSFPAAGFKHLKVETSGGGLTVVGQDAGEARIEMYVRGNNGALSDAEIKERLEKYYQVNIDKDATTLTAIAKRVGDDNWNWSGSLEAHTSGGGIHADITGLGDRLSLSTSGGSIEVKMPMDKGMDLDLKGSKVQVAMNNFNGVVEDDRVQGKLNGGGIPVSIHTSGGRVRIN